MIGYYIHPSRIPTHSHLNKDMFTPVTLTPSSSFLFDCGFIWLKETLP